MAGLRKRKVVYLVGLLLVIGAALGYYFAYYTPVRQNATYNANLVGATDALMDNAKHLLDTASLPIFNDLNERPTTCEDNAAQVSEAITQFNGYLSSLEQIAAADRQAYVYDLGGDAAIIKARKERAEAAVKQSRQVIADYAVATDFLRTLADIRKDFVIITEPLSATSDVYDYFYRTEELRVSADRIGLLADRVLQAKAPVELVSIQTGLAVNYKETATGYRDVADGLNLGDETKVYNAMHRIEAAVSEIDTTVQKQYATVMDQSVLMKELSELPDKYVLE